MQMDTRKDAMLLSAVSVLMLINAVSPHLGGTSVSLSVYVESFVLFVSLK